MTLINLAQGFFMTETNILITVGIKGNLQLQKVSLYRNSAVRSNIFLVNADHQSRSNICEKRRTLKGIMSLFHRSNILSTVYHLIPTSLQICESGVS